MPDSRRRTFLRASGVALLAAVAGCGDSLAEDEIQPSSGEPTADAASTATDAPTDASTDASTDGPASTDGGANLRVIHAVPDAPNFDVVIFGDAALKDETFRQVSQYLYLGAEQTDLKLVATGGAGNVLFDESLDLDVASYTGVALGEQGSDTNRDLQFRLFEENLSLPDEGSARLRFVNAAPDSSGLQVVAADGDETVFDGVGYGRAATTTLSAGMHQLEVRPADGGDAVTTTEVRLDSRGVYSAFGMGYVDPSDAPTDAPFEVTLTEDGD
ncbi:DUF4397 domain-containing protein [Haloprofundus salilacus]|uniref:DUF4397 domain-containing protein n=1 Tax=Haloprofundus salilacus TaxID=2876190 RepID=UPI001CCD546D|nr:DUF4397 domain-containing protein [Haloprofundus salilacus]